MKRESGLLIASLSVFSAVLLLSSRADAVPSFARQTGVSCAACHVTAFGPALTSFGRDFKMKGYTMSNGAPQKLPPVSAMVLGSFSHTKADQDGGAAPSFNDNDNVALDEVSLFYAGRITDKIGMFGQVTYDGVEHQGMNDGLEHFGMSWDNVDVRFADTATIGKTDLVYGLSLNNSPTVQDLWNSTPIWGFPYVSSALSPTPAAAPILEGSFADQVVGLSAYAMFNNLLYAEAGAYKMLSTKWQRNFGVSSDAVAGESPINGLAPYGRVMLQHDFGSHYASVGMIGMSAETEPGGDSSAGTDRYTDIGWDATYQFNNNSANIFTANLSFIHEKQELDASHALGDASSSSNSLDTFRANAGWVYQQTYALSGGPFIISGDSDSLVYADSRTGSPDSQGYIIQAEYIPFGKDASFSSSWKNLRLGLQYTYYSKFDGSSDNYDGSGRSAEDNNTLYAFAWLSF
ncbi:cytochrome C [Candidatus Electronema sp. JM]|uniref:cytochrome C n=1 Tax=Candidatus Electronema sp. JM TaxID=3401571 RepID=UPI003AA7E6AF